MPDAIPGATYHDSVFDATVICNGTTVKDGEDIVILEYENSETTCRPPLKMFRRDDTFELTELP